MVLADFEITSPGIVEEMLQFFEERCSKANNKSTKKNGALVIRKDKSAPVTLMGDDEFADRYFFVVGRENRPMVRFELAGADLTSLIGALRQAMEDLEES